MHSHIYLDESGDLGWTLNKPYRNGGSSRYLTIGYLICNDTDSKYAKRLVKSIYSKYGFSPKKEKKATDLSLEQKKEIATQTIKMLADHPTMKIGAITVMKERVQSHIRSDGNKLYNFMIKLATISDVSTHITCKLVRDNRSIKVASGNSCIDYLQTILWFECNARTMIYDHPTHSHLEDGIIFIDWITNIVWKHYEDGISEAFGVLQPHINNQKLFF